MMKRILVVLSIILSVSAYAQTQSEMNEEALSAYKKADKELNIVYGKILTKYTDDIEFVQNLKISQRLWVKFRDAELALKYPEREPGHYGSVQPMCRSYYLEELTNKRVTELKIWLAGGDETDVCKGSLKSY